MSWLPVMRLSCAACLLASYGWVLHLARHPDVDPRYRAFYIERSSSLTPREWRDVELEPYVAGTPVPYWDSSAMLFDGWSAPEEIRWSVGEASKLLFVPADVEAFTGRITLDCDYFGTQRVTVSVNGTEVASFRGRGWEFGRTVVFDPSLLRADEINSIRLEFSDARSPAAFDQRRLAMALAEVTIH